MAADEGDLDVVEGGDRVRGDRTWLGDDRPHLHHRADTVEVDHEVDLAAGYGHVPAEDLTACPSKHPGGETLRRSGYPRPMGGSIGAPGSSSSMLTSRKVSTRTFVRNRAGRYMSHTHASSNSSSK